MNRLGIQLIRFGLIGVLCFLIDYGIMILLTVICQINYLFSSGISFCVSVSVNYLLSIRFVFKVKETKKGTSGFVSFVVLSITGLLLTELLMWLISGKLLIHYTLSKFIVTAIVMVYNFVTKKFFLESKHKEKPYPRKTF